LVRSLGFFRTTDAGTSPPPRLDGLKLQGALPNLAVAVARGGACSVPRKGVKPGVALQLNDTGEQMDKEFERF